MNVLLADDHAMFRQSLRALLEREGLEVGAEAGDGREAVRLAAKHRPRVAVLDFSMPLLNGIETARAIRKRAPQTATILLTMFEEDDYVLGALAAGVRGYVLKAQAASDLVTALREVANGAVYLSPGISGALVDYHLQRGRANVDPLTDRERQVLQLVAEGKTMREIATLLSVSVKTAESHRTRLMRKLDLHNTAGLVRYAIRSGLIQA
ncbi:response regulator transcription factor [Dokdonella sp.]|uniref:response regulator n=1 Tax=Dokdonella sp. TaxID=2291710 RepID=UPI001B262BBE|nr:response regulator transcription factor [Dokdonella sp.]MBO9662298.1 response regulator transcription factor [Dokdonella sp.]